MSDHDVDIVLGCDDLGRSAARFVEDHGWRLETIFPADDPSQMILWKGGRRLRLVRDSAVERPAEPTAPDAVPAPRIVEPVVSRLADAAGFGMGRAGMTYRDLVPDRLGGALIASHIRIDDEGPVQDYVHFHDVAFQLIFCRRGRVEVVYEDQGPPFVLEAGDAVLQPPGIRHRVLHASAGMEVVELASPAVHATHRDHDLVLPDRGRDPDRDFAGQRFVRHVAADAEEGVSRLPGYVGRGLGLGPASGGAVEATVHRVGDGDFGSVVQDRAWRFFFVLEGPARVVLPAAEWELDEGDSVVVPPDDTMRWEGGVLLEVAPGQPLG